MVQSVISLTRIRLRLGFRLIGRPAMLSAEYKWDSMRCSSSLISIVPLAEADLWFLFVSRAGDPPE